MVTPVLSVRVDPSATERLDRVAEALTNQARGARITRANALRVVIEKGLDLLEVELGITKPKRKR